MLAQLTAHATARYVSHATARCVTAAWWRALVRGERPASRGAKLCEVFANL